MWFQERVFYQIYPLNFCGAPSINNGHQEHRLTRITKYIENYLAHLGIGGIYFNPVFSSGTHGYDTGDYLVVDERLGSNEDFKELVQVAHEHDIKIVVDGVFHHVGRSFFAFEDLCKNRCNSIYKDWFIVDFHRDSVYQDGFWYEGWENHYELVKLNLGNPKVQEYLVNAVKYWIEYFDIDGIRLDVAYLLPSWFMSMLHDSARCMKADFFLLGETLGDNQGRLFDEGKLDSITDYPLYKSIWSGFNSHNMFEIAHTLKRSRMEMYLGRELWTFLDNHDVTRIASQLTDKELLPAAYGLVLALPGIPCIYYGSEWGIRGAKKPGQPDDDLRPEIRNPFNNELSAIVAQMIEIYNQVPALRNGSFREIILTNEQYVFERELGDEKVIVGMNISDNPWEQNFPELFNCWNDFSTGEIVETHGTMYLPPKSIRYWVIQ